MSGGQGLWAPRRGKESTRRPAFLPCPPLPWAHTGDKMKEMSKSAGWLQSKFLPGLEARPWHRKQGFGMVLQLRMAWQGPQQLLSQGLGWGVGKGRGCRRGFKEANELVSIRSLVSQSLGCLWRVPMVFWRARQQPLPSLGLGTVTATASP